MNEYLRKIILTADGSSTISDPLYNENFHSLNGAISESIHVFIENGIKLINNENISILEIGFGTGLNCLLTLYNKLPNQKIIYHSLDKYPINLELAFHLNYCQNLKIDTEIFERIIKSDWDAEVIIEDNFVLHKMKTDLLDFIPSDTYDLIYFDAFSPNVQPELWTEDIFSLLYNCLNYNGILTTYSSKGNVKRALRSVGFMVNRIQGPLGKRHMLQAIKK